MYSVIRIRGLKHVRPENKTALESLNLDRKNHCVVVPIKGYEEVLKKVQDYTAYGTIKVETLTKLIQKRGRLVGDKPISAEFLKEHKFATHADLAKAVLEGKASMKVLGIKPVFRLNSPKKGYGPIGMKKPVQLKGPLGFHPEGLDALMQQMM